MSEVATAASAAARAVLAAADNEPPEEDDDDDSPPPDQSRSAAAVLVAAQGPAQICCTQACKGRGYGFISGPWVHSRHRSMRVRICEGTDLWEYGSTMV